MQIFGAAVLAISALPCSAAFMAPQVAFRSSRTSKLNLQNADGDSYVGPAATIVAGLTLASQMAGATVTMPPPDVVPVMITQRKNSVVDMV
jgi:hypothetical protein